MLEKDVYKSSIELEKQKQSPFFLTSQRKSKSFDSSVLAIVTTLGFTLGAAEGIQMDRRTFIGVAARTALGTTIGATIGTIGGLVAPSSSEN